MSLLLEIQKQLNVANERVAALEASMRDHPGYPSIAANLDSAARIQRRLEAAYIEAAASVGVEVCRYRAFDDYDRLKAGAAFESIALFQKLVSVVYGAVKYGHKQRATIPSEVAIESSFGLGFAFSGSIGVVLTVRSDTTLFGDSFLDDAMETVFAMTKAQNANEILTFANKIGPGPINSLYRWADDNVLKGMGAEIEWHHGTQLKRSLLVQRQELSRLRTLIDETSSKQSEEITVVGVLKAADMSKHSFRIKRDGLPDILGTFANRAIDENHPVTIPGTYSARILKTTGFRFSTGEEKVEYELLKLQGVRSEQTAT